MCHTNLRLLCCFSVLCLLAGSAIADDWDPNDDTFDPDVKSVVAGNRSWIGDPSPFVYVALSRTGYTHVQATDYAGFDPSVNISLMVPQEAGETQPPGGGMIMLNKQQVVELVKAVREMLKAESAELPKRLEFKTMLEGSQWALLSVPGDKGQRLLQLESKGEEKTDKYQFSVNATKKLLGAIEHSLSQLAEKK